MNVNQFTAMIQDYYGPYPGKTTEVVIKTFLETEGVEDFQELYDQCLRNMPLNEGPPGVCEIADIWWGHCGNGGQPTLVRGRIPDTEDLLPDDDEED